MDKNKQETDASVSFRAIFLLFLRIAAASFGGFMVMISVVENVVVTRRKLLNHKELLDGISLASILPGPQAINVCAYVGWRLRGWRGAFVAVLAAVLPAFLVMVVLAHFYFLLGSLPALSQVFGRFVPAVAAIIFSAGLQMGRKSLGGMREAGIALAAFLVVIGAGGIYSTVTAIIVAGFLGWLFFRNEITTLDDKESLRPGAAKETNVALIGFPVAPLFIFDPSLLMKLFTVFAGMSFMLFGGGYVFIPLLREAVVNTHHWVTTREFVDAIALGQVTPGPVLISAAFIGYKVAGLVGAAVATIGMFGPPAVLMVGGARVVEKLKRSGAALASLRGIRAAVVGMIFAAVITVGQSASPDWMSAAIFVVALYALLRHQIEAIWIVAAAGMTGLLFF